MSNKLTGGHAFNLGYDQGMTLRDYFAINADIGNMDELSMELGESLLSRKCPCFKDDPVGLLVWWAEYRAKMRYIEADAMLEARKS